MSILNLRSESYNFINIIFPGEIEKSYFFNFVLSQFFSFSRDVYILGGLTFSRTRSACEIERLFILIFVSGCLAFLLMWSAPSNQNNIAVYERILKDKLDRFTVNK